MVGARANNVQHAVGRKTKKCIQCRLSSSAGGCCVATEEKRAAELCQEARARCLDAPWVSIPQLHGFPSLLLAAKFPIEYRAGILNLTEQTPSRFERARTGLLKNATPGSKVDNCDYSIDCPPIYVWILLIAVYTNRIKLWKIQVRRIKRANNTQKCGPKIILIRYSYGWIFHYQ